MSSEVDLTIGDVCVEVIDCEHKTAPEDPEGSAWSIGTPAMSGHSIDYGKAKRISAETFFAWTRRGVPKAGDLILAREAPVGLVVRVPEERKVALGQRTVLLRPNPKHVDPVFLYYLFTGDEVQRRMRARSEGSTVAHLNVAEVRDLRLPWMPPLAEQRAIAGVLGALDDKIESNRRIAQMCVRLARLSLCGAGRPTRLGDCASIEKGLSYKGAGLTADRSAVPMFNLGNFGTSGWLDRSATKFYAGEFKPKHTVRTGDLIVANTDLTQQRVILGRPALVPPVDGVAIMTHHVFAVRCEDKAVRLALWAQLNGAGFRERAEGYATGTTVASMPSDALTDFMVEVPSIEVANEAQSMIERVWAAEAESDVLVALRDTLLPELLSGRLRARDAEQVVSGAV